MTDQVIVITSLERAERLQAAIDQLKTELERRQTNQEEEGEES